MKIKGQTEGEVKLHSKDATFFGIDAYPTDELSIAVSNDTRISYTALLLSRPEVFEGLPQWKSTGSLEQRLEILNMILDLVSEGEGLPVFCFHTHIRKGAAYKLGAHLLADFIYKRPEKVGIKVKNRKTVRFKFEDKTFKEMQAVSMTAFASAITIMAVGVIKVVSSDRFAAIQTPIVQFLLDNISGNAQWNKKLILYIIENTELGAIISSTIKKSSCVKIFGLETPISNQIEEKDEIEGTNNIPIMVATDWFTRISSEYESIKDAERKELDETTSLIVKIVERLIEKGGYISEEMPTIDPELK